MSTPKVTIENDIATIEAQVKLSRAASRAVAYGAMEAKQADQPTVTDVDLLLGMLRTTDSAASQVLALFGVTLDAVRAQLDRTELLSEVTPAPGYPVTVKPLSASAKRVLALAHAEADEEGSGVTSAHHMLLALLQQQTGLTAQIVDTLGLDVTLLRGFMGELADTIPPGNEG